MRSAEGTPIFLLDSFDAELYSMLVLTPPIFVFFGFVESAAADVTVSRVFRFFKVSVVAGVTVPGAAIIAGLETTVRVTVVFVVVVSFFDTSFFCFLITSSISSASFNCTFAFFFSFSAAFSASFFSCSNFRFLFAASVRFSFSERSNSSNAFCFHRSKSWSESLGTFSAASFDSAGFSSLA